MRLFIALKIPDDLIKTLCSLRVDIPGARWVPAEQIHLTLAFLGEVQEATLECLVEKLSRVQVPVFDLRFSGVGCFPDRRRPRVLWIGLEPQPHLKHLADKVHAGVLTCDIPQEERPFSPHITLARVRIPAPAETNAFLDRPLKQKLPPFSVREFTIYQSRLTRQGAEHIPIKNFPLQ